MDIPDGRRKAAFIALAKEQMARSRRLWILGPASIDRPVSSTSQTSMQGGEDCERLSRAVIPSVATPGTCCRRRFSTRRWSRRGSRTTSSQSMRRCGSATTGGQGRSIYRTEGTRLLVRALDGAYAEVRRAPGVLSLADVKRGREPLARNASASLWNLGDGVACLEFHSKMNALDAQSLALLRQSIDIVVGHGLK